MDSFADGQQEHAGQLFTAMHLTEEAIAGKEFDHCVFQKCRFLSCTFRGCRFMDCTFKESLLSAIKFIDCSFMETVFRDSKIMGIDWTMAGKSLRGMHFLKCDISQTLFGHVKLLHLVMTDCTAKEVDFTCADCSKADFEGTDFERSVFHGTNLTEASFKRACNYAIDSRSNTLKKTKFSLPEAVSLLRSLDIVLED
jgi:fluoroquinolone resistance protein